MIDVGSLPSRRQRFKGSPEFGEFIEHEFEFFRKLQIRGLFQFHFEAGFFYLDGFANISLHDRFHLRDFPDRAELEPACGLRVLTGPGEDTMDILEQDALEKGERTGFLQAADDDYVLALEGVAGLTPLEVFRQFRVEKDRSKLLE